MTPIRFLRFFLTLPVAAILVLQIHAAFALESMDDDVHIAEQQQLVASQAARIDILEKDIAANKSDDAMLMQFRAELEAIDRQLVSTSMPFRSHLDEINKRVEQLGAPPAEGQPAEPEVVSLERQSLTSKKAQINAVLGQAEDQSIRVNRLVGNVAEMRRQLFKSLLTQRYDINFALFGEIARTSYREGTTFYRSVSSWLHSIIHDKLPAMLAATFIALLAAVALLMGGRRLFGEFLVSDPSHEPSWLSRVSVAFWSTLIPAMAVGAFLMLTYLLYDSFGLLGEGIDRILSSLFFVIGVVFFVDRLGRAVFSPKLPNWRLVAIDTRSARLMRWLIFATVFFTGLDYFLGRVYEVQGSPLALTVGESLLATVLIGFLVMMIGQVQPLVDADGQARRRFKFRRYAFFLLGAGTIVSALLGYLGLARFLATQIVITGAVLATMYIGFLSSRAMSDEGAFAKTSFGSGLGKFLKLDENTLDQLGVVVSLAVNIFIVVVGLPLILILWGFHFGDIAGFVQKLSGDINIGSLSFSLVGLATGIVVFGVGYFLTRWFQSWLDGSVMARGRVDGGVRNSIRTTVGYAGVVLAGLIGLSAAGIDLSKLALVAGALSLGIGFGLQNIVSNFVSGLILLVERPFKTGDWIVAGTTGGTVRKISVRATEIETFQRQTVIVPNSELINSSVGNWTHRNKLARVDVRVNVAYDSNARRAHEIMNEIAKGHPLALKTPEPFVAFLNFGPAALEFELRMFIADIYDQSSVLNDIRFAVLEAFARENIEMPSTPRAVVEKVSDNINPHGGGEDDALREENRDEAESRTMTEMLERLQEKSPAKMTMAGRRKEVRETDPDQG